MMKSMVFGCRVNRNQRGLDCEFTKQGSLKVAYVQVYAEGGEAEGGLVTS